MTRQEGVLRSRRLRSTRSISPISSSRSSVSRGGRHKRHRHHHRSHSRGRSHSSRGSLSSSDIRRHSHRSHRRPRHARRAADSGPILSSPAHSRGILSSAEHSSRSTSNSDRSSSSRSSSRSSLSSSEDEEEDEEEQWNDWEKQRPLADWVCTVCSNLNSAQRVECFRCGVSYGRSCHSRPSVELAIATGGVADKAAEDSVLAALGAVYGSHHEPLSVIGSAVRGQNVHVRFGTAEDAARALLLCRCRLALQDGAQGGAMRFSQRMVAEAPPLYATLDAALHTVEEATDPALKDVPRALWPADWEAPQDFSSADEERRYLGDMAAHWQVLSTAQKTYYDAGVKRALQREAEVEAANVKAASGGEQGGPAQPAPAAAPPAAGNNNSSAAVATPPSSAMSSLKRRLAEKKAALAKEVEAAAVPASGENSSPVAATSSSSAVSDLKQRLALKKAQMVQSAAACASPPQADTLSATGHVGCGRTPTHLHGFPVPHSYANTTQDTVVVLRSVPWEVARRIMPAALLDGLQPSGPPRGPS